MERISIIVYSCEKNAGMWRLPVFFIRKYWINCPCKLVLLTDFDSKSLGIECGYDEVIECDADYLTMIRYALSKIESDFFITWMDDYLLYDLVDNRIFLEAVRFCQQSNALNVRFGIGLNKEGALLNYEDLILKRVKQGDAYSLSTHAGIWSVSKYIELLSFFDRMHLSQMSAWDFERQGSMIIKDFDCDIFSICNFQIPYIECVRKGKWFPEGVALIERDGFSVAETGKSQMTRIDLMTVYLKGLIININPNLVLRIQNSVDRLRQSF